MENKDFRIDLKIVWILVIGNLFLTFVGALFKILHWEFSQLLLTISLIIFFSSWIIILSDMTKSKIYNKTFWVLSMFILPMISGIFYITMRNKLIRLGDKFDD